MKKVKPSYEILSKIDGEEILKSIEVAGRTCYKSEERITKGSAEKFVQMIINRNHVSVIEHEKITVKFIFDRGISHEMVRHRLCSFSQESTRYCNYTKDKFSNEITVIDISDHVKTWNAEKVWKNAMNDAERHYNRLIELGESPQIARSVLPNSLKTEIVVTANLREWRLIFKLRTSSAAHPQIREVMTPLYEELKGRIPVIFDDLTIQ